MTSKNITHLDGVHNTEEYDRRMREALAMTKRWRDGKGVVHVLVANRMSGYIYGVAWTPACGKSYSSNKECHINTPVTCMLCMAKEKQP